MQVFNSITQLVGQTPIVKLNRLVNDTMAQVYVKLESLNPGHSVKDRVALSIIEQAEQQGLLTTGDTIIEATSGNTGIGLAMMGAAKGYKVKIVMPDTMSVERRLLLKAYGADLVLTPGACGMKGAIAKAQELVDQYGYFMARQFDNEANVLAHQQTTAQEIMMQLPHLDVLVAGVGTGGTITGIGEVLKQSNSQINIVAVEPASSPVLSGQEAGPHQIQGIGAGFIPSILNTTIYDEIVQVTNEQAITMARQLAQQEGILAGFSSGAALYAAIEHAKKLSPEQQILVILPDIGERYLSTHLFNDI